jgi:hypothetical protein
MGHATYYFCSILMCMFGVRGAARLQLTPKALFRPEFGLKSIYKHMPRGSNKFKPASSPSITELFFLR